MKLPLAGSVTRTRYGRSPCGKSPRLTTRKVSRALPLSRIMLLDEAGHRHIMELAGKHRRAHHFGAELGIGKAEREGERRAADRKSKWCGTERKAKPERSEDKCDGHTGLWLILWSVKRAMMPPANKTGARRTSGLLPSRARGRPQQEP